MRFAKRALLVGVVALVAGPWCAFSGDEKPPDHSSPTLCGRCGAAACCQLVKQVVCEVKEESRPGWKVECEVVAITKPSLAGAFLWLPFGRDPQCVIPPHCGQVRVRHKLVKEEVTREVPTYRCIAFYLCSNCRQTASAAPKTVAR